ncbi:MAG: tail fiber domain-containing protein [Saprospiraceae bacterium]
MKNLILLALYLLLSTAAFAQAPNKFRYQAVARDQAGTVINGNLNIRLSFLEDGANGQQRYAETHSVSTNAQGVFDLSIGDGQPVSGNLNDVNWKTFDYWLKVEMKTPALADFIEMGKTQLLSVPYARYAAEAGNDWVAGPGIIFNGNIIAASDASPSNELQTLSLNGNSLAISNGNSVLLPTGTTYTEGSGIEINGNVLSATDASTSNELQNLSLNGSQLSISNGNTVNLPTYSEGFGIQINGTTINAEDPSPTNEIQTLSLNGQQLSLSNGGGSVQLPNGGSSDWTTTAGVTSNSPLSNSVAIGTTSDFDSKLYVSASGSDHGGNFYTPGSGDAVHAYNNGSGTGIRASSLSGTGAYFSSVSGDALIIGSGNVGIGVSNPTWRLQVDGSAKFTGTPNLPGVSSEATGSYSTAVMGVGSDGADGAYFVTSGSGRPLIVESPMTGKGSGILTSAAGTAQWETYIDAAKDYNFAHNGTLRAWIYDTDGSYHNSSDRSLKKDIQAFSNVLPRLSKLQAYTYHMKDAEADTPISVGFMAQEVEEQFPQLVTEKEGHKTLCYDHFAVLSVQAIKEQQTQIEDLKKQLEELKQMLRDMAEK